MFKIIYIILVKLTIYVAGDMMVFPFKHVYEGKNKGITMNDKEYNGTNYAIDYFSSQLYIEMNLGTPSQTVKVLLSGESCAFKIGKSKYCVYLDQYLSYYNRNLSIDFAFTPKKNMSDMDFNNTMGRTAEDSLTAFTDIGLTNRTTFRKVGFFLGTDTNDKLCGIIGLEKDNFICARIYNFVNDTKKRKFIKNYNFMIKYNNSFDNGQYIIGGELKDIIKDFNENKVFKIKLTKDFVHIYKFGIAINKVVFGEITDETNNTIIDLDISGEINNDRTFIVVGPKYFDNFSAQFFDPYFNSGACCARMFDNNPQLKFSDKYKTIECDKDKFGQQDLNKFPKFYLYLSDFFEQRKIFFDGNDLFTEGKYKYFFNIIFDKFSRNNIELGKVFLKKYPVNFNYENDQIEIYDNFPEEPSSDDTKPDGGEKDQKGNKIWLYIPIIVFLVAIVGVLGYFLGKYFNKMRKKRANELNDDDYEYKAETKTENKIDPEEKEEPINTN